MTSVSSTKAADAEPRIQPYSKGLPAINGLAALTVSASAIDVVGASAAAWTRATRRNSQKPLAHEKAAAAPAANTMQSASTRRSRPDRSAKRPTRGPAAKRISVDAE